MLLIPMIRTPRRVAMLAAPAALFLMSVGCESADVVSEMLVPGFSVSPSASALRVGDTASVVVRADPRLGAVSARWTTADSGVLSIDPTTSAATRVRVRAVGAGRAVLNLTATAGGQTITATTPFTVTAAP